MAQNSPVEFLANLVHIQRSYCPISIQIQ